MGCGVNNCKMENVKNNSENETQPVGSAPSLFIEEMRQEIRRWEKTAVLRTACRNGNIEMVEEILNYEYVELDLNSFGYGYTPLTTAVRYGHLDIVRRLIKHPEVDINGHDCEGYTPLIWAAEYGHFDILRTLLEVPKTELCYITLYRACFRNHVSIVKLLCQDRRCSPCIVNKRNIVGNDCCSLGIPGCCEGARRGRH